MASNRKKTESIRKKKHAKAGKARKRAIRSTVRKAAEAKVDVL